MEMSACNPVLLRALNTIWIIVQASHNYNDAKSCFSNRKYFWFTEKNIFTNKKYIHSTAPFSELYLTS